MSADGDDDSDDDNDVDREDNVGDDRGDDDGDDDEDDDEDDDDDDDRVDRNVSLAVVAVLVVVVVVSSVDRGGRRLLGWRRTGRRCRRSRLPSPMVSSKRAPSSRARQQFSCEQYRNSRSARCARDLSFFLSAPFPLFFFGPPLPLLHRKKNFFPI